MEPYALDFEDFSKLRPWNFNRVNDLDGLNRLVAEDLVNRLKKSAEAGRKLMVICPVGPLDYRYWVKQMHRDNVDGSYLVTVNMDEYIDAAGRYVDLSHPLSFRRYMKDQMFDRLLGRSKVPVQNIHFPLPDAPEETTNIIDEHGGADLCYGGLGLTGHFAFNDPPEPDQECIDNQIRNSRTRVLEISRESRAQMCMGGSGGNWEIIPKKAVTLGMYELLKSRKIHLTFMRSWHAGVLRTALFGPVTGRCPGSFVQDHRNVEVTVTELAAERPLLNVAQRIAQ
jgi:glucosamine-6-phosphate deaminase